MGRGRIVNNRLTDYIIPTSLDAPEMDTIIVEKEYPLVRLAPRAWENCRWTGAPRNRRRDLQCYRRARPRDSHYARAFARSKGETR